MHALLCRPPKRHRQWSHDKDTHIKKHDAGYPRVNFFMVIYFILFGFSFVSRIIIRVYTYTYIFYVHNDPHEWRDNVFFSWTRRIQKKTKNVFYEPLIALHY